MAGEVGEGGAGKKGQDAVALLRAGGKNGPDGLAPVKAGRGSP